MSLHHDKQFNKRNKITDKNANFLSLKMAERWW